MEASKDNYTGPTTNLQSSSDGIASFRSEAFRGQLRNHLFVHKYKSWTYRWGAVSVV